MPESARPPTEPSPRGRVICGWCNRVVAIDPSGVTRHVTCNDCQIDESRENAQPSKP